MTLGEITATGAATWYSLFVLKESEIFYPVRAALEQFLKKSIVSNKWFAAKLNGLWKCNLCLGFWIGLILSISFNLSPILALTSPTFAFILTTWVRKNLV